MRGAQAGVAAAAELLNGEMEFQWNFFIDMQDFE
jgi:hypothetical protein